MITLKSNLAQIKEKFDRAPEIARALKNDGAVFLEPGTYYMSSVDVPKNGFISGAGAATKVILLPGEDKYLFKIREFCTIQNMMLLGQEEPLDIDSMDEPENRTGILFISNYNGLEDDTLKATLQCFLSNLFIENFSGSGIRGHNTGYSLDSSMYGTNLFIRGCGVGINLDYWTEFNKFTNVNMRGCLIACVNNGGNNVFVNCNFHGRTGLVMDNRSGKMQNNSHGSVVGCMFDHCGKNKGDAIVMYNQKNRFIFSACHFFYDAIRVYDSPGIVFDACLFGRESKFYAAGNTNVVVSNGSFRGTVKAHTEFFIEPEAKVSFVGCLNSDTGEIVNPTEIVPAEV